MKEFIYAVLIVALVAVVTVTALSPGMVPSVISIVTMTTETCLDTPYDSKCVCEEGFRKISVPWLGIPRWSCEELDTLILDPESETFVADAIDFVQAYLNNHCAAIFDDVCEGYVCGCPEDVPNCGAFAASHPIFPNQKCIAPAWGYGKSGERLGNVECLKIKTWQTPLGNLTHEDALELYGAEENLEIYPKSGTAPWRMMFFLNSKTDIVNSYGFMDNYCYNEALGKKCTTKEHCDYYENPDWCVPNLPVNVVPYPEGTGYGEEDIEWVRPRHDIEIIDEFVTV